jgi:cell division septation protein DedD
MNSEHDEYPEEEDKAARSIFAAGWFRAVLLLTVLAIAVIVALPYLLDWFEPLPPPVKAPVRAAQNAESPPAPTLAASPAVQSAAPPAPQLPPAAAKPAPDKERPPAPTPAPPRVAAPVQALPAQLPRVAKASDPTPTLPGPAVAAAKPDSTRAENPGGYWIQLGLFKERTNADGFAKRLRGQGFSIQVAQVTRGETGAAAIGGGAATFHAVRAGAFQDRSRAIAARDELYRKGFDGFIIESAAK